MQEGDGLYGSTSHAWHLGAWHLGKFAFGDRTIPIHARTRGFDVSPQEMDVYYGTELSAVVHTN
jgi:hypothetical protein